MRTARTQKWILSRSVTMAQKEWKVTCAHEAVCKSKRTDWIRLSDSSPVEEGLYPVIVNGEVPEKNFSWENGVAMGYYWPDSGKWDIDGFEGLVQDLEVIAWYPLPDYKEETNE